MYDVDVTPLDLNGFEAIVGPQAFARLLKAGERGRALLEGRTLWNVNSTAQGGGVAEMLQSIVGYVAAAGIDVRWSVIDGDPEFFALTKRIHNHVHGIKGDGGELGPHEGEVYRRMAETNADAFLPRVRAGDIVILHDPQPAGMAPRLRAAGAVVVWRCHIGIDVPNELSRSAQDFVAAALGPVDGAVFSRKEHVWPALRGARVAIIPPSIDAFSAKNQELDADTVGAILAVMGVGSRGSGESPAAFSRHDGHRLEVRHPAILTQETEVPEQAPLVVQVSRWDRLKDPLGVMAGMVEHVPARTGAHLILAGPAGSKVADDPESAEVLDEVRAAWAELPDDARRRVHLACLPMEDVEENAAMVNALQRRADLVVQKSLAEGFGLTVAEAMWKGRPVVASRVGGIQEQVAEGTGLLIDDATDLGAFGAAVTRLLDDPDERRRWGVAATERVRTEYLAPRHLVQWVDLLEAVARR